MDSLLLNRRRLISNIDTNSVSYPMVVNLLPQFTQDYWAIERLTISSWSGTDSYVSGNVIIVKTSNGSYSEGYLRPKSGYYPYLTVGHTYYLRWKYYKTGQFTGSTTLESFWPEIQNPIVSSFYGDAGSWQTASYVLTLQQSQWPNNTVTNGNYSFRFDVNYSGSRIGCTVRFADPLLIDLTECYTNKGLSIPSKSKLDGKTYFYGSKSIYTW